MSFGALVRSQRRSAGPNVQSGGADEIRCGPGQDTIRKDLGDVFADDCENVVVRSP